MRNLLAALVGTSIAAPCALAQLCGTWSPANGLDSTSGVRGWVNAACVHDDGSGPRLVIGGNFTIAPPGSHGIDFLGAFEGSDWIDIAPGLGFQPTAVASFDDGTGRCIYAAAPFRTSPVARFRAGAWENVGVFPAQSLGPSIVTALVPVNIGGQDRIVLTGWNFGISPDLGAAAQWDGTQWSVIPLSGQANCAVGFQGRVYFGMASGPAVWRYDGATLEAVPGTPSGSVGGLAVANDGSGEAVFVAGLSGGVRRFDGAAWQVVGGAGINPTRIAIADLGSGPRIFAASSSSGASVYRLDGGTWTLIGSDTSNLADCRVLLPFDNGGHPRLMVGGTLQAFGAVRSGGLASFAAAGWELLPPGVAANVMCIAMWDRPTGRECYVGGELVSAGGVALNNIARWTGSAFEPLGAGLSGTPNAITVFDDGTGAALYAGGVFVSAGGQVCNNIAKWNGASWSPMGLGIRAGASPAMVKAMLVHDDGTGPALYVGGQFTSAGLVGANNIARWRNGAWSAVESGTSGVVLSLSQFDDGTGPALYVGGSFDTAGGIAARSIARRRAGVWSPLGTGLASGNSPGWVSGLTSADIGSGPELIAAGYFSSAGGMNSPWMARWNGQAWSRPSSFSQITYGTPGVHGLVWLPGAHLIVAGTEGVLDMVYQGQHLRDCIAWDGSAWAQLGAQKVGALALDNSGSNERLLVGGPFADAGGLISHSLAVWTPCVPCYANCDGSTVPPVLNVLDFNCFLNRFATAEPYANCDGSTTPPVLNVLDFNCFLNRFAQGCP